MSKKLFLVCPFSCMENFIRKHYGDDVFFITAMAAAFQYEEQDHLEEVKALIERESITEIIIINDTSCRFIAGVLKKENEYAYPAEQILQKIFNENYSVIMQEKFLAEQQEILAMFNVKHQANEMLKSILFQPNHSNEIKLTGLVTKKESSRINEINFNN